MQNINIENKGDHPVTPTWVTQNGNNTHRALKINEKTNYEFHLGGLTKREEFARTAMNGLLSNNEWAKTFTVDDFDEFKSRVASASIDIADALLKRLNEK
jgi:hypothetical protein